ncbi:glycosyltransferase [Bdellovibrio svalbardensis]|uniref:Glycosyltransferase n=1 Tax=Bdellovibrio svalbardensis TaxID=2972972 RepID=A0ABT6DL41_9BACT|nr:glycosyltransferase [Bdellovibrio svalbardensis]MDG0817371.1 glycosyltransferase [Bdellovibrio svalbardensis]
MEMSLGFEELFVGFTYLVVVATSIFTLDDLFIDAVAFVRNLKPRVINLSVLGRMKRNSQKQIAIMIANWKEAEILGPMIRGNIRGLDYERYTFFLGVYPNDTATWEEVSRLEKLYPNKVVVVVNSLPGPTSKGQMLNEIARQVLASEEASKKRYDLFLMQDSEDVLHPHSLTLMNFYSQEAHFIQIPVFSFDVPKLSLVGGVYIDEFSESHTKDLLVRQDLGAAIPSAGVGTCMSRDLVVGMMLQQEGRFLKEDTLTEDYHLGIMAKPMGFKSQFVCTQIESADGTKEFVATREYFPSKFMASVRQKSRWTLGIAYQGSQNIQWSGSWVDRYFLLRDRKGPACSILVLLATIVFVGFLGIYLSSHSVSAAFKNPILQALVLLNTAGMLIRLLQRMRAVYRVNGLAQSVMVLPRWFVANAVNVMASYRAHMTFKESIRTGTRPVWVKTDHQIPAHFGALEVVPATAIPAVEAQSQ